MKASKWNSKAPRKPGYYWARGLFLVTNDEAVEEIAIVELYQDDDGDWQVAEIGDEIGSVPSAWSHWKGPIPIETTPVPPIETQQEAEIMIAQHQARQSYISEMRRKHPERIWQ